MLLKVRNWGSRIIAAAPGRLPFTGQLAPARRAPRPRPGSGVHPAEKIVFLHSEGGETGVGTGVVLAVD